MSVVQPGSHTHAPEVHTPLRLQSASVLQGGEVKIALVPRNAVARRRSLLDMN
tara:strand:- start:154 stop:312 length:159 start_codon:yes stop_codon:yes gene_type:complete